MTEQDYINVSNLQKIRMAKTILKDIDFNEIVTGLDLAYFINTLSNLETKLFNLTETKD